jgi:hypothetical protein
MKNLSRALERQILATPGVTIRARHPRASDASMPDAAALVAGIATLDRGRLRIAVPVKTVGGQHPRLENPQPANRCRLAGR